MYIYNIYIYIHEFMFIYFFLYIRNMNLYKNISFHLQRYQVTPTLHPWIQVIGLDLNYYTWVNSTCRHTACPDTCRSLPSEKGGKPTFQKGHILRKVGKMIDARVCRFSVFFFFKGFLCSIVYGFCLDGMLIVVELDVAF